MTGCQKATADCDFGLPQTLLSQFKVKLPQAEPFTATSVVLIVQSDLIKGASEDRHNSEHMLKIPNIWLPRREGMCETIYEARKIQNEK